MSAPAWPASACPKPLSHLSNWHPLIKNGRPLIEDTSFSQRIARLKFDLTAATISNMRIIAAG
jgi:hypothetical protein